MRVMIEKLPTLREAQELMEENDAYRAGIKFAVERFNEIRYECDFEEDVRGKRLQEMKDIYSNNQDD